MDEQSPADGADGFKRATLVYALALALIASLSLATHLMVDAIVRHEEATARVVNVSGRQRMLSQRIAMLSLERAGTSDPSAALTLADELQGAIDLMEKSHRALTTGSEALGISPGKSAAVAAIYQQPPYSLDEQVTEYIDQARKLAALPNGDGAAAPLLASLLAKAHGPILLGLDAAVKQYEADSEESIRSLRVILQILLVVMLAALAAEALLIFRPLFQKLEKAHLKLLGAARTDPLTGCMNRRYLMEAAAREVAREKRTGQTMTVLILDIDHFKRINDTYGHALGDEALLVLVRLLIANIRASDLLGRIGGEEFVILLPATSIEQAEPIAEKLRACVADATVSGGGHHFTMTASIGMAELDPARSDFLTALEQADKALYSAKNSGRNRAVVFTRELENVEGGGF